ncbi:YiiX/YebB-like N1pC/P60 family cysteine hydrolase [Xanthomonas sacchari]|uniref:YiiX/YebB-like N1pC/P60 family cysteine hydrolase n=1 Tax=Xanthomonas sacchari TaxID=56458 RepID=UPI002256EB2E|nr:YiiX/YebB-like N1pC/P60 family cysteine hydrolase [Xanthomonas sacchari]MCW0390830.1 hypothetical protein [Xanthomonas sacchari]
MNSNREKKIAQSFVLDVSRVEAGDIILTSEHTPQSKGIRITTSSDYSHAMICVGHSSCIHAVGKGVEAANLQRQGFDRADRVCVMRYKGGDRIAVVKRATEFARRFVGMDYSVPDALATRLRILRRKMSNRQFCSRLVAQAYAHAGVSLVSDPDFCLPEDLFNSSHLEVVPLCVRETTDIDRFLIGGKEEGPLFDQAKMLNAHFKEVREITGLDLQTRDQIYEHLISDGSHDQALSQSLERSGYLKLWQVDVEKNPWRYDAARLLSMGGGFEDTRKVAERESDLASDAIERYARNVGAISQVLQSVDRKYFRLEHKLYSHLVVLHSKRLQAAKAVLAYLDADILATDPNARPET